MKFLKEGYMNSFREIEYKHDIQNQLWDNPTFNAILNKYGILKDNIELEIYGNNSILFTAIVPGENYWDSIELTGSDIKTLFKDPFIRNNIENIYNPKKGEYEGQIFFNLKPAKPDISENHLYYVMHNVIDWIRHYSPRDKRSIIQVARACHKYDDDYSIQEYANAIKFYNALDDFKRNKKEETLKEDIDPKTNDTDDLYAVWYPYVGKRVVDKDTMIKMLREEIARIERGTAWNVGEGLAFRCIQAIDNGEPLIPSHDRTDGEWFKKLRYDN